MKQNIGALVFLGLLLLGMIGYEFVSNWAIKANKKGDKEAGQG